MRKIFEIILTSRGGDRSTQIRCVLWSPTSYLLWQKLGKLHQPLLLFLSLNSFHERREIFEKAVRCYHPPFCGMRLPWRVCVIKCTSSCLVILCYRIRFSRLTFLTTCSFCPVGIPRIFAQSQGSDYCMEARSRFTVMIRDDPIWRTRCSFTFVAASSKQDAYFFFWKAAECNQSFDFYLTEDLGDWSKALLYLDPSVRKHLVSLWLVSHLVSQFRMS